MEMFNCENLPDPFFFHLCILCPVVLTAPRLCVWRPHRHSSSSHMDRVKPSFTAGSVSGRDRLHQSIGWRRIQSPEDQSAAAPFCPSVTAPDLPLSARILESRSV